MIYLFLISIIALLISTYSLIYDWRNNLPRTVRGVMIDNDRNGLILRTIDHYEDDIRVHLADGFRREMQPFANGLKGIFMLINQYVLAANVGIITVKNSSDLSSTSSYLAPHPIYWLGIPGGLLAWFSITFNGDINSIFNISFLASFAIFAYIFIRIWFFMYRLKMETVASHIDQFVMQLEYMRNETLKNYGIK